MELSLVTMKDVSDKISGVRAQNPLAWDVKQIMFKGAIASSVYSLWFCDGKETRFHTPRKRIAVQRKDAT